MAGNDLLLRRPAGGNDLCVGRLFSIDRAISVAATADEFAATIQIVHDRALTVDAVLDDPIADLRVGHVRTLVVDATTDEPAANIQVIHVLSNSLEIDAVLDDWVADLRIGHVRTLAISATLDDDPIADVALHYDINLLSAVHAVTASAWQDGHPLSSAVDDIATEGVFQAAGGPSRWSDSLPLPIGNNAVWSDSERLEAIGSERWQDAGFAGIGSRSLWQDAAPVRAATADRWQDANRLSREIITRFRLSLPLLSPAWMETWHDGITTVEVFSVGFGDGFRLDRWLTEVWQDAGWPGNARRYGHPIVPPIVPYTWDGKLYIGCVPARDNHLYIGGKPCKGIRVQRTYVVLNTASLVRWPDLTPLPVTDMTVETTFDSWCWSLTATLAGPDAWALVQPNPLACEVQATINGAVWRFLLDVPDLNRTFNNNRVTLKGRSRSAWLHDPYTPHSDFGEVEAREMQQLGEAALDNTGWTLDWQGENWLVPAGRYHSWNTPIGVLIRLANTTDDGLYSHPWDTIITLQKRWPVASWLVDDETPSIAVPEAALLNINQQPVYTNPINGIYVSGTSHGVLALVKITGTDGAMQPPEPIVDELLCDEFGVAARQRGLNALSDSGAGWELTAETLFAPSATPSFPLVTPGQIVSLAGVVGVSRSCRISVRRSGDALNVRQTIGLERREVED